jgi:hypothetical protein
MAAHLVDHDLKMLLLPRLRRFFGKTHAFAAALQIDHPRKQAGERSPEGHVEGGTQEGLLETALGVQQDFDNPVYKPEEHCRPFYAIAALSLIMDRSGNRRDVDTRRGEFKIVLTLLVVQLNAAAKGR